MVTNLIINYANDLERTLNFPVEGTNYKIYEDIIFMVENKLRYVKSKSYVKLDITKSKVIVISQWELIVMLSIPTS